MLASFFSCFQIQNVFAEERLIGVVDGVKGKEVVSYVLTGYQGYSPYHFFGNNLENATYSGDLNYIDRNGNVSSTYRAIKNETGTFFSENYGYGYADIELVGEMQVLARTGKYYAVAGGGLLSLQDNNRSVLSISLSNGNDVSSVSSNKLNSSDVLNPDWVETDKVFIKSETDVLRYSFKTNEKYSIWNKAEFYLFEPSIKFGLVVDSITNITEGKTLSKNSLIHLEAKNLLSDLSGENAINYYKGVHKIEWEIVSGSEFGEINGEYLKVYNKAGTIVVRPKCLTSTYDQGYTYGDNITFVVDTSTVSLSATSNFEEGVIITGLSDNYTPNRYVTAFFDIQEGYTLLNFKDELENVLEYSITASGLYRVRVRLNDSSKIINVYLVKTLTIDKVVIKDKYYDKTTNAEIDKIVFKEGELKNGVEIDYSAISASFLSSTPGNNIEVNLSGKISLVGNNSYMYDIKGQISKSTGNILKRNLVVVANDITIEYGEVIPNLTYEIQGDLLEGDFLSGSLYVSTNGEIGNYEIQIGSLNNQYYDIEFRNAILSITKRHIVISGVYVDSKTYDRTNAVSKNNVHYNYTGSFLNSSDVKLEVSATFETSQVGEDINVEVIFNLSGDDKDFYELNLTSQVVYSSILPKTLNVQVGNYEKIYGEDDPAFTYSYNHADLIDGDVISGNISRTSGEDVGEYLIGIGTLSAKNYLISFTNGKLTIKQREVSVVSHAKTVVYGDEEVELTYSITSGIVLDNDSLNIELSREEGNKAGEYKIKLIGYNQNYKINFTSSNYKIIKRDVFFEIKAKNKVYDGTNACDFEIETNNLIESDNVCFEGFLKFVSSSVGLWNVEIYTKNGNKTSNFDTSILSGSNLDCYNFDFSIISTAEIIKRDAFVNLDEEYLSKIYGEADKGFPITYSNVITNDVIVGTLSREAGEDCGIYNILQGSLNNENNLNYNIIFNFDLRFEIKKREIIIEVADNEIEFGEEEGEIEFALSNECSLPNSVSLLDIIEGKPTRQSGNNVGKYKYLVGTLKINQENSKNYTLTFVGGYLTIYSKQITIKIKDCTKVYGSSDPVFEYEIIHSEIDYVEIDFTRTPGEDVGVYVVSGTVLSSNYDAYVEDATLTIVPTKIAIKINSKIKTYGETDPELTFALKNGNFKFNDDITTILDGEFVRTSGEDVGEYEISYSGNIISSNYEVEFENGSLSITPKKLFVIADDIYKFYHEDEQPLTYSLIGLVNSDEIYGELEREVGEEIGEYKISIGSLNATNYQIEFTEGVYTIRKRKLIIEILPSTKVYDGTQDCELNFTLSGDIVENENLNIVLNRESGVNVGKYLIKADFQSDIYDVEVLENYLEITKRPISILVKSYEITYGDSIPEFEFETVNDIDNSSLNISLYRTDINVAGTYKIYVSVDGDQNYDINIVDGTILIKPREIHLNISDCTKVYGSSDPIFNYTIESGEILAGDIIAGVITRELGEDVGEYSLICAFENINYLFYANDAKLTILKKNLYLTTSIEDKIYDGNDIAKIRLPILIGLLNDDEVYFEFEENNVAKFEDAEIGSNKAIIVYGGNISGKDATNYNLVYPTDLKASITNDKLETSFGDSVVTISASQNNTNLVSGSELVVLEYNKDTLKNNFSKSKTVVEAFNFKIENNGKTISQTGKIELSLDVSFSNLQNVQVFRINSDGNKTLISSSYADGKVSFTTEESGTYVIVADNDSWIDIVLICSGAVVLFLIVVIIASKRKKIKKNKKNAWFLILVMLYL